MSSTPSHLSADSLRRIARSLNTLTWDLLERPDRSPADDERMLAAAYASLHHWSEVGTAVHRQRGHWLVSRVCAVLRLPETALWHAERCLALTREHAGETGQVLGFRDFDAAYAHEAMARALLLAGDPRGDEHLATARSLGAAIATPEDRRIFEADIDSPPLLRGA